MGGSLAEGGMLGAARLLPPATSKRKSLPRPHCPPTSGVLVTLGTGPLPQLIGPTIVPRSVALIAGITALLSSTEAARLRRSGATSKRAWVKPTGWDPGCLVACVEAGARLSAPAPPS